jgi:hypothetical protein
LRQATAAESGQRGGGNDQSPTTGAADIDERRARRLVGELIEDDMVRPIPDQRVLVHNPSSEGFESIIQLAVFHRGWRAATSVDAEDN